MTGSTGGREAAHGEAEAVRFANFELDLRRRVLLRDGVKVEIRSRVFELLVYLVSRAGETVGTDELIREVWGGTIVEDNTVAVTVLALRRALGSLGDRSGEGPFVITVRRVGYRFVPVPVAVRHPGLERLPDLAGLPWVRIGDDDWMRPVDATTPVNGRTLGEWAAAWWTVVLERPAEGHPVLAPESQVLGPVLVDGMVLLFGNLTAAVSERTCSVPVNHPLLVHLGGWSLDNAGSPPAPRVSEGELISQLKDYVDGIDELLLEIDGVRLNHLERCRVGPVRYAFVPHPQGLHAQMGYSDPQPSEAFCEGYWLVLSPPPAGRHEVRTGSTHRSRSESFRREVRFNLVVD